jgi:hypothetical protein
MKFLYALPVILFYLVGCGSSTYGIYTGGGQQCPAGLDPLKTTDIQKDDPDNFSHDNQKLGSTTADLAKLPPGNYQFNGAQVFFKDTNNGIMIQQSLPVKPDPKLYRTFDATNATKPVCVANMDLVRNSDYKDRTAKVALAFRVTQPGTISAVASGDISYHWKFVPDHPEQTVLQMIYNLPDATQVQSNNTSINDLKKVYDDQNFDDFKIYCVGACGPNDNPKQYQIRATRTVTPDKGGDAYLVEVMSSFIVDKNQN